MGVDVLLWFGGKVFFLNNNPFAIFPQIVAFKRFCQISLIKLHRDGKDDLNTPDLILEQLRNAAYPGRSGFDHACLLAYLFKQRALAERRHMAGPVLGAGDAALQDMSWSL